MFKKILLAALAGIGGYFVYKKSKSQQAKAEQDLWAEAVDPVTPGH
ncbi:DLW-39 family protein [Kribbella sp. NBC_01245]|nr:DLW-39 family protein [Kribbella sp. NBC_01245]